MVTVFNIKHIQNVRHLKFPRAKKDCYDNLRGENTAELLYLIVTFVYPDTLVQHVC